METSVQEKPAVVRKPSPTLPLVDVFNSVWLGISLIALIFVYGALGSAVPTFRQFFELTEFQFFNHPLFVTLIALFCICLVITTLRRIRFNLRNAGVLTVHTGLLVLCAGSLVYFGQKIEGDLWLDAPMIRVVSIDRFRSDPENSVLASIVAFKGEKWESNMPMLGGKYRIEVADVRNEGLTTAAKVTLSAAVGDEAPRTIELDQSGDQSRFAKLNDRIALWLVAANVAESFYDDSTPILMIAGGGHVERFELPQLPYYNERFVGGVEPITDLGGKPVESGRLLALRPIERWRMPIELDNPDSAAADWQLRFEIDGYLPYARLDTSPRAGGDQLMPIARVRLDGAGMPQEDWLAALSPDQSLIESPAGPAVEFTWLGDKTELDPRRTAPLKGQHVLEVFVKDKNIRRTYDVTPGQKIAVEGTDYTLTVEELRPSWPLMSAGFQNARTPIALVWVETPARSFQRSVLQRFPQLNQDRDRAGKKILDSGGLVDTNLELSYFDASRDQFLVAAGANLAPTLVHTAPGGGRSVTRLEIGKPVVKHGAPVFTLLDYFEKPDFTKLPKVIPGRQRRPLSTVRRGESMIRVKITSTDGKWSRHVWVPFSQYNTLHDFTQPVSVQDVPGVGELRFIYGRTPRMLPAKMALERLKTDFYPGQEQPREWTSFFRFEEPRSKSIYRAKVWLNNTTTVGDWTFFQSQASTDHKSWTVLGVGNRQGVLTMLLGCVLITLGMAYAFCVKPVLVRRYKQRIDSSHGRGA